jgi:type VI secretion system lysozyme-like protein
MRRPDVPRRQRGARPPLFDRLFDLDPAAADSADARLLPDADLRLSVARHLGHLLDCRSPVRDAGQDLTVLDWGVPDIGALPPRDRRAQAAWLAEVRRSLARFEPRLRDPELELRSSTEAGRSTLCIRGSIGTADAAAPVLFELALEAAAGGS